MVLGWPSCKLAKIEPQELVQSKIAETETQKSYKIYGHNKNENTS